MMEAEVRMVSLDVLELKANLERYWERHPAPQEATAFLEFRETKDSLEHQEDLDHLVGLTHQNRSSSSEPFQKVYLTLCLLVQVLTGAQVFLG